MKPVALVAAFALPLAVGWMTAPDGGTPLGQDHDTLCAGGSGSPIDVSFEILAVDQTKTGESLSVHVEVHNHFKASAEALAALEIVDDRGNTIQKPERVDLGRLEAGRGRVFALQTPPDLKPGFYELRVTAAGLEAETKDNSIAMQSLFFSFGPDGVLPLAHDDFLLKSNAGLAFIDADVKETN